MQEQICGGAGSVGGAGAVVHLYPTSISAPLKLENQLPCRSSSVFYSGKAESQMTSWLIILCLLLANLFLLHRY